MNTTKFTQQNYFRSCTLMTKNQNPISLILNPNTKFIDILKLIRSFWKQNVEQFRLFLNDGTEIEEKDLIYIKKGTNIYVQLKNNEYDLINFMFDYDIIKRVGEGGQGIIYLGKHKRTKVLVAIKKLSTPTQQDQTLRMIEQESLILKQLDHKNIVKLYEKFVCQNQNVVIMILEYLNGGSLLTQANSKLTEVEAKQFSHQIIDAIAYCHEKKIVHCDLKLENIMLSSHSQKQIKIIDFGVSNYIGEPLIKENVLGTLSYMAPEILSNSNKFIQPEQDIWAIGCIIYGLVFGKLPFEGNSPSETYRNILQCNYYIPKKSVSNDLIHLLNIIFVVNPKDRANIFDIQCHNWFKDHPKIFKLNINGLSLRIGRSSSVIRNQSQRYEGLEMSQRNKVFSRRSLSKFDKVSFVVKTK